MPGTEIGQQVRALGFCIFHIGPLAGMGRARPAWASGPVCCVGDSLAHAPKMEDESCYLGAARRGEGDRKRDRGQNDAGCQKATRVLPAAVLRRVADYLESRPVLVDELRSLYQISKCEWSRVRVQHGGRSVTASIQIRKEPANGSTGLFQPHVFLRASALITK